MEKVLIVGRGAREHALAHKALLSGRLEVYMAPGNAGMRPPIHCLPIEENNIAALRDFIRQNKVRYVVVGPELPLARGLYDDLHDLAIVVGPPQALTFLEASKARAKEFMKSHGIPTAPYWIFDASQASEAEKFLMKASYPIVLKASGLAAGKGVLVAYTREEALSFAGEALSGQRFGQAGKTLVIEEFLSGVERSVFILADGKGYVLLPVAQDYKRLQEGDQGPNTGGMGAFAPTPDDPVWIDTVREKIIEPTLHALKKAHQPYKGFLYFGLMKVGSEPFVLEYNIRLGDPEAQVILPLIENDLDEMLFYYRYQKLSELKVRFHRRYAVGVVAATAGYPEAPQGGARLPVPSFGEGGTQAAEDAYVYWAGVREREEGVLETTGGRVYTAVGLGDTLEEARQRAYATVERLPFEERVYRRDIALL
jgi:phosphoribosylamine--glycine ligase